jgi:hypothetical protein
MANVKLYPFTSNEFISSSGINLKHKIEYEAFDEESVKSHALMALPMLGKFSSIVCIPSGGRRVGKYLEAYSTHDYDDPTLIIDDVWTTGAHMYRYANDLGHYIGLVIFYRNYPGYPLAPWCKALFTCHEDMEQ